MPESELYNEIELLVRIAEGDEKAFADVYRHYARKVFPFLMKLTGSEEAAEDVIQNTFLSLWLTRTRLPEIDRFAGYVFRTAGNHGYNWLAKEKSIGKLEKMAAESAIGIQDITSQEILFNEAQRLVNEAVNQLPEQRKKIFRLYREAGFSYNEIAAQLNISPSTVRNSVAAALESIRKRLTASGLLVFFSIFFCSR